MDVIIVPCTQEKIWQNSPDVGPIAAKDAYTKPCFTAWRAYAEQSGCPWFILSTKYGLLAPDQKITNYNVPVSAAVANPDFLRMLAKQGRELNLSSFSRVVLLDWEKFEPLVRAAIPDAKVKCVLRKLQY